MTTLLEIEKVDKVFRTGFWLRKTQVLHQVSFSVHQGSIFGFLGANGAGKTTLIQMVVGVTRPTHGAIRLLGQESWTLGVRGKMGYLPERPYFHDHLTGEQLLLYLGELSGMNRPAIRARIPVVLEKVSMTDARKVELRKYSKGMLQRIGIAQAILHDPEFLVLDEPMSGLDPVGRKEIRELILKLAEEGKTIFFSSHVIPDVEAICDSVGLLQKGRMIGCGPVSKFLSEGPQRTEVGFVDAASDFGSRPGVISLRKTPDGVRAIVEGQDNVDRMVSELVQQKARLLWVTPIRPSLESLFEEAFHRE